MDTTKDASEPVDRDRRGRLRELMGLLFCTLLPILAGFWWMASADRSANRPRISVPGEALSRSYVGSAVCIDCHATETAHFARSGHARTFRRAADKALVRRLAGTTLEDPERPGTHWSYRIRDGVFEAVRTDEKGGEAVFPIQLAFGSGYHAISFLTLTSHDPAHPKAFEHRMTYYANRDRLDLTPGHTRNESPGPEVTPDGRILGSLDTKKCFGCHTTPTSKRGLDRLDFDSFLPNVSCERCHGPCADHVQSARAGAEADLLALPMGPGRWTAEQQLRLCGECHRHPANEPPGDIRRDNVEIIRFQPVGLTQSACYKKSRGKFSCLNCHDPHTRPTDDEKVYDAVCLSCHSPSARATERIEPSSLCPVSPAADCIGCHMRRRETGQHVLYTDHWIQIPLNEKPAAHPYSSTRLPDHAASQRRLFETDSSSKADSKGRISSR